MPQQREGGRGVKIKRDLTHLPVRDAIDAAFSDIRIRIRTPSVQDVTMSAEAFRIFRTALDEPPRDLPRLRELLGRRVDERIDGVVRDYRDALERLGKYDD